MTMIHAVVALLALGWSTLTAEAITCVDVRVFVASASKADIAAAKAQMTSSQIGEAKACLNDDSSSHRSHRHHHSRHGHHRS